MVKMLPELSRDRSSNYLKSPDDLEKEEIQECHVD